MSDTTKSIDSQQNNGLSAPDKTVSPRLLAKSPVSRRRKDRRAARLSEGKNPEKIAPLTDDIDPVDSSQLTNNSLTAPPPEGEARATDESKSSHINEDKAPQRQSRREKRPKTDRSARRQARRDARKQRREISKQLKLENKTPDLDRLKTLITEKKQSDTVAQGTKTSIDNEALEAKIQNTQDNISLQETQNTADQESLKEAGEAAQNSAIDKINKLNQKLHHISKTQGKTIQLSPLKAKNIQQDKKEEEKLKMALTNTMISAGLDSKAFDMIKLKMVNPKYEDFVHTLQNREDIYDFRKGIPNHGYIKTNWLKSAAENVGYIFAKLYECEHQPDLEKSQYPNYVCRKCAAPYIVAHDCEHQPDLAKSIAPEYKCIKCDMIYIDHTDFDKIEKEVSAKKEKRREKIRKRLNPLRIKGKLLEAKIKLNQRKNTNHVYL